MASSAPSSKDSAQTFVDAHRRKSSDDLCGIARLAEEMQTTPRAIRFYESKGLISPKRVGTTRIYGRRERVRLQLILRAKALGLTLKEVGQYLELYGKHGEGRQRQLTYVIERSATMIAELEEKKAQLERTIDELKVIRKESGRRLRALSKG